MSHNKNYARMWLTMCTKDKAQRETQNGNSSKKYDKHNLIKVIVVFAIKKICFEILLGLFIFKLQMYKTSA